LPWLDDVQDILNQKIINANNLGEVPIVRQSDFIHASPACKGKAFDYWLQYDFKKYIEKRGWKHTKTSQFNCYKYVGPIGW
jgi:hypothetical protein